MVSPSIPTLLSRPQVAARPDPAVAFVPQFRSPGLPDGEPWGPQNGNCGPTSIVNALRLVGLDVPGFHGEHTQAAIDAARMLATGSADMALPTLKSQQAFALRSAGADVDISRSLTDTLTAVRGGAVALIGGNRAADLWPRRADDAPPVGVANHAAVIAAYRPHSDDYLIDDPALPRPVAASEAQLASFTQVSDGARMLRVALLVHGPGDRMQT